MPQRKGMFMAGFGNVIVWACAHYCCVLALVGVISLEALRASVTRTGLRCVFMTVCLSDRGPHVWAHVCLSFSV